MSEEWVPKNVENVGELMDFLEQFDDDVSVRVNDDGREMVVKPVIIEGMGPKIIL